LKKTGTVIKCLLEADPQFKKVNLYDSNMKLVSKESLDQYKSVGQAGAKAIKEEIVTDKKKELKQEVKPDKGKLVKKNNNSLLPKKRERTRKGLGVS